MRKRKKKGDKEKYTHTNTHKSQGVFPIWDRFEPISYPIYIMQNYFGGITM